MSILDEIFAHKRVEVAERQRVVPIGEVRRAAEAAAPALDFTAALLGASLRGNRPMPALIAEVKCASPSRGRLVKDFDPLALARTYQQNGAAAISVLTDERFFQGYLDYLRQIVELRNSLPQQARIPLLRKDFLFDPYQVYEARAAGADAILLIVAHLDLVCLRDLHALATSLGMTPLVEVHSRAELEQALVCSPSLVGINNRNLHDFSVSLETTTQLCPLVPQGICVVAESGIHTPEDAARLAAGGVDAILVGEALVTAADVAAKVRSFVA